MESSFIDNLCKDLPSDVRNAVHNEFTSRWKDIEHIWEYPQNRYKVLQPHQVTVRHLLAISTFHRRVLSGFDGARDFYKTVSRSFNHSPKNVEISIGKFKLNQTEYNKLLGVEIEFGKIRKKYGLDDSFFEYDGTDEFLTNCRKLYINHLETGGGSENKQEGNPNDFPF